MRFFRQPVDDVLAALEPIVLVRSPLRALGPFMIALIVSWFIYVPIHELLHVLGCVASGGEVSRLEIAPKYGGALWARIFPFVVSGSDYAGRLSGFDWKNSDWIYLATDFMPYVLTVLIGVPLIKLAGRRRRPVLFAIGVVVGLTPVYQLPNDYYEMGSIVTTRAVTLLVGAPDAHAGENPPDDASSHQPGAHPGVRFGTLRSDDVFLLLSKVLGSPDEVGLSGATEVTLGLIVVLLSVVMGLLLALVTYWLGHAFAVSALRIPAPSRPAARKKGQPTTSDTGRD